MSSPREAHPSVQTWLDKLRRQGKSPHTIKAYRRALGHLEQWLATTYGEPFDPTVAVNHTRLPSRQPQSLSGKQLRRLLRALIHSGYRRDIAMIELLAGTGVPVGELLQLQVGDLVLRQRSGWVTVREGKHGPLSHRSSVLRILNKHTLHAGLDPISPIHYATPSPRNTCRPIRTICAGWRRCWVTVI